MTAQANTINSDLFQKYLTKCKDQVKTESAENYYPVNVVAEAYSQGFSDGKISGKKDFIDQIVKIEIEKFVQKSNQIYILSKETINFLLSQNFKVCSLHINLAQQRASVVISIPNEILNDDSFVEKAYSKIFEFKAIFCKLFNEPLDIGFVGNDNLVTELLAEDGYGYTENYHG